MGAWGIAIAWLLAAVAQGQSGVPAAADAAGSAQSATATLRVRVNDVAFERRGPKQAVIEYTGAASGGEFRILKSGATIRSGRLTRLTPFSEWGGGKSYFSAEFSALTVAGRYELEATLGHDRARSAAFEVVDQAVLVTTAAKLLDYFHASRWTSAADRHIRIYDTDRFVDVWGGWKDAGGDTGKYLSHLSFANFFNPQQTGMVAWALGKSYDAVPQLYARLGLTERVLEETFWGADYLHRVLDPEGYFYETVFDRWGEPGAERMVTGFEGLSGVYSAHYRAAYREGGGLAIAALARASIVSANSGAHGEFTGPQYLADAERAFAHLETNNTKYCADGVENIIDDYTALLAATELYRATGRQPYLQAARRRAQHLSDRLTPQGWFVSDGGTRPYYHGVEAGFPLVALVYYLGIEHDAARVRRARQTIRSALAYQLALDRAVANPYDYARQTFRVFRDGKLAAERQEGFFMPHANETGYWWQGESARLASLAAAAVLGGRVVAPDAKAAFSISPALGAFAQHQLDWTLGRNPYGICMLYGFGAANPPHADSGGDMLVGGISNGITGATASDAGRGIVFAEGPDENNWRWVEQWLPHSAWFLLAATVMAQRSS